MALPTIPWLGLVLKVENCMQGKPQLNEVKLPKVIFKHIFEWKWMKFGGMTNEVKNTSKDFFHFSVNVIGNEVQPIDFLTCHFFTGFVRKSAQTFI